MSWPDVENVADIESLKAQWEQDRDRAAAQVRRFEELLECADDFESHRQLWRDLHTSPVSHPELTALASLRPAPDPATAAEHEEPLARAEVLALLAQDPTRRWSSEDVRTALRRRSARQVRSFLKDMAAAGLLEIVHLPARHIAFRFAQAPGPIAPQFSAASQQV